MQSKLLLFLMRLLVDTVVPDDGDGNGDAAML